MIAMIEISKEAAVCVWTCAAVELYELHDDMSESLIKDEEQLLTCERFGIEGELFGEPYPEQAAA
ncbi:hypothetical protein ABIB48_002623 [Arthrobacter sp. UYCu511]|uniref:hypothetical protein n=1 Tax=Arthrobacter sp. UYCu511 TaxID=3156337 RepID=UPI0033944324